MTRSKLDELRKQAARCTACDLYKTGTQVVFGEGPEDAEAMFVGEQPGDQEDKLGHPFVGPAGKLLDKALADAGIDREHVYLTNVVKHFKWIARGKRRIHQKPNWSEVAACKPWFETELEAVQPRVLVCLGRPLRRRCSGASSGSLASAVFRFRRTSPSTCSPPSTPPRSCAAIRRRASASTAR